jgi:hypothetical protein
MTTRGNSGDSAYSGISGPASGPEKEKHRHQGQEEQDKVGPTSTNLTLFNFLISDEIASAAPSTTFVPDTSGRDADASRTAVPCRVSLKSCFS